LGRVCAREILSCVHNKLVFLLCYEQSLTTDRRQNFCQQSAAESLFRSRIDIYRLAGSVSTRFQHQVSAPGFSIRFQHQVSGMQTCISCSEVNWLRSRVCVNHRNYLRCLQVLSRLLTTPETDRLRLLGLEVVYQRSIAQVADVCCCNPVAVQAT